MKKILIVGAGGREHAIARSLLAEAVEVLFCETCAIPYILPQSRFVAASPLEVAQREGVDLVIVGPEGPLVAGLVDELEAAGFAVFGPSKAVARLEGSKSFAKEFMQENGVRTAFYKVFDDVTEAQKYLSGLRVRDFPLVLKADGLAAGKGVLICQNHTEAEQGLDKLMREKVFDEGGSTVLVEGFLQGYEASILAFCDGTSIRPMLAVKDHKKIFEGECGENTGGMGCVAPHPQMSAELLQDFHKHILEPTLRGIQNNAWDFCGIIFFGLMISHGLHGQEGAKQLDTVPQCYLLEYNMRFGDPEAQTILPLLKTPLLEILQSCLMGCLEQQEILWHDAASCTVVAAAENYPQEPRSGDVIANLKAVSGADDAKSGSAVPHEGLYLAGVTYRDGVFYSSGGRVLACNATAASLAEACKLAYQRIERFPFRGMQYRRDIGATNWT